MYRWPRSLDSRDAAAAADVMTEEEVSGAIALTRRMAGPVTEKLMGKVFRSAWPAKRVHEQDNGPRLRYTDVPTTRTRE